MYEETLGRHPFEQYPIWCRYPCARSLGWDGKELKGRGIQEEGQCKPFRQKDMYEARDWRTKVTQAYIIDEDGNEKRPWTEDAAGRRVWKEEPWDEGMRVRFHISEGLPRTVATHLTEDPESQSGRLGGPLLAVSNFGQYSGIWVMLRSWSLEELRKAEEDRDKAKRRQSKAEGVKSSASLSPCSLESVAPLTKGTQGGELKEQVIVDCHLPDYGNDKMDLAEHCIQLKLPKVRKAEEKRRAGEGFFDNIIVSEKNKKKKFDGKEPSAPGDACGGKEPSAPGNTWMNSFQTHNTQGTAAVPPVCQQHKKTSQWGYETGERVGETYAVPRRSASFLSREHTGVHDKDSNMETGQSNAQESFCTTSTQKPGRTASSAAMPAAGAAAPATSPATPTAPYAEGPSAEAPRDDHAEEGEAMIAPPLHWLARGSVQQIDSIDTSAQTFRVEIHVAMRLRDITQVPDKHLVERLLSRYHWHNKHIKCLKAQDWKCDSLEITDEGMVSKRRYHGKDDKLWDWSIELRLAATINERFEVQDFPFDQQGLNIPIVNDRCPVHRAVIYPNPRHDSSTFRWKMFQLNNVWQVPYQHRVFCETALTDPKASARRRLYCVCSFTVLLRRRYGYYVWNVSLPILVLTYLGALTMTQEEDGNRMQTDGRLGASLTLLLTAVAYKLVVADKLPSVSYQTTLDKHLLGCIFLLVLASIENVIYPRFAPFTSNGRCWAEPDDHCGPVPVHVREDWFILGYMVMCTVWNVIWICVSRKQLHALADDKPDESRWRNAFRIMHDDKSDLHVDQGKINECDKTLHDKAENRENIFYSKKRRGQSSHHCVIS